MRAPKVFLALTASVLLVIAMMGCGGNASPAPASGTPAPTPTTPTPTTPTTPPPPTSPTPPTTPPAGGGGTTPPSASSAAHYEASLDNGTISGSVKVGTLTIDNGKVTYQFGGWVADFAYRIDFCQFPVMSASACTNVDAGATTNSAGAASGSFQFPHSGTFAGWFRFSQNGGNPVLTSGWTPTATGTTYSASFVRTTGTLDTLQSGTATVTNGMIHIQIAGASPSTTYQVYEGFSTNGWDQVGTLTTDASGNATADFASKNTSGLVILNHPKYGDSLETSFTVP